MCKRFQYALILTAFCAVLNMSAQNPPCPSGTLANVLGTSCSVGPLTLNFQNNFSGILNVFDHGAETSVPISAAEIEFTPVNHGNRVGFKLTTHFLDGPGPDSTFTSAHFVNLFYTPQANPGFDIVGEFLHMDATIQGDFASEQVIDFQDYPSILSTSVFAALFNQNGGSFSQLVDHTYLPSPALFSDGFAGHPEIPTTSFETSASGSSQGALQSATFLYSVGPAGPLPPAALTYSNIDLPGAASTLVSGITNSGKMTGTYQDAQGIFHAYVTREHHGFTTIDFPGATSTFGGGLNDHGDIAGAYTDADGNTHGFLLQDGNFTTLDFPGAILTQPFGINDRRQIVGFYETADFGSHGFLFDHDALTNIDHTPANTSPAFTFVFGINNSGKMVGSFFDPFTVVGFVQEGDLFHRTNVPGQVVTFLESLNEQGDQVGTYTDINGLQHGFLRRDELFRTVDFPGGNTTFPLGINAAGIIVGQYSDAAGNFHSFLAEPQPDGNSGPDSASVNTASTIQPGAAQPARICGSPEWLQHPEQMRLSCKAASLSSSGSQK